MHQYWLINCNKCVSLMEDVNNTKKCVWQRVRVVCVLFYFYSVLNTSLKKKNLFSKKVNVFHDSAFSDQRIRNNLSHLLHILPRTSRCSSWI